MGKGTYVTIPPHSSHLCLFLLSHCNTKMLLVVTFALFQKRPGRGGRRVSAESPAERKMLTAVSGASLPTENLEYNVEPQEISHPDVGRYFSEFTGTHYIPNAELEIRYPEDLEFVYETVQNIYSAKEDTAE